MVNHVDWFSDTKPILYSWDKYYISLEFNVIEYTDFTDRTLGSPVWLTLKETTACWVEYPQLSENISKVPPAFPMTYLFEARFFFPHILEQKYCVTAQWMQKQIREWSYWLLIQTQKGDLQNLSVTMDTDFKYFSFKYYVNI